MMRQLAPLLIVLTIVGCGGGDGDDEQAAEPTTSPAPMVAPEATQEPEPEPTTERDVPGEPVPPGIVDMIQALAVPEGALQVTRAAMVRYLDVYYVVAAEIDTPRGTVTTGFLHAPADQEDLGNGGQTWPLDDSVAEFTPFATVNDDPDALDLSRRVVLP